MLALYDAIATTIARHPDKYRDINLDTLDSWWHDIGTHPDIWHR